MKSNFTLLILLSSPLIIIIYLSFKLSSDEDKAILKIHYKVICEVKKKRWKVTDYEYTINGNKYLYTKSNLSNCAFESEKFWCMVSKTDLESARIFYSMPIIDTNEYDYDTTKPKWIVKSVNNNAKTVAFAYFLNKIKYDRVQFYHHKPNLKFKDLIVVYRKINPTIGYLIQK